MLERRLTLFRLFGISVRIHASWLILGLLIAWSLAGWFGQQVPELSVGLRWTLGGVGAIGLLFSIVFHEMSHSIVARMHGIPIKGITLFLFGGVAEMEEEPKNAKAEFLMAIVGPLSSFVLAGVFGGVWLLVGGSQTTPAGVLLFWLAAVNFVLAVFNLLPAFPLDGGRVLRAALWGARGDLKWATRVASAMGSGFGLLLIVVGVLQVVLGGAFINGMWMALIGMFLRFAARQPYQQLLTREALEGEPVRRFMVTEVITVPRAIPIRELVEDYVYRHQRKMFPVVDGENLRGCITIDDVREVPNDEWDSHSVGEIARPCDEQNTIGPDEDAVEALNRMTKSRTTRLMVVEEGRLVGVLALRDLLGFLSLKMELEPNSAPPRQP